MDDLSLMIYDLCFNSINAKAKTIEVTVHEDISNNSLILMIRDDGCGIPEENIEKLTDPFYTTRTTRKVGLGIPFLMYSTQLTEGSLEISSQIDCGTQLKATFVLNHIDCLPMGDIAETLYGLCAHQDAFELIYKHKVNDAFVIIKRSEILSAVKGVSLTHYPIKKAIKSYLDESIQNIKGD
jgi:anti-sigma regulatory factor (Ser/Thr protein kinase)